MTGDSERENLGRSKPVSQAGGVPEGSSPMPEPQDGHAKRKKRSRRSRGKPKAQTLAQTSSDARTTTMTMTTTTTKHDYASLPETELKALCKARGLRFGGGKAVLVARLVESDPMQMQSQCQVISVDMLSDDVLLPIFGFYLDEALDSFQPKIEAWQTLVHVCRRWRALVFASPRRLNLRIVCTDKNPVREMLHVWPPLPIVISGDFRFSGGKPGFDNIIATLEHNNRICEIRLNYPSNPQMEMAVAAMWQPFPALTTLDLQLPDGREPIVLPDSFLGGFAPHLQKLVLGGFLFQALPKLLLSTTHLSTLFLWNTTPHSEYISPDVMVTYLSALTSLERLWLKFLSPSPPPNQTGQPSLPAPAVLPALTRFLFTGFSEYLEDLVTRIDTPLLNHFSLVFEDELAFETPQVIQFISRTPKLKAPEVAKAIFDFDDVQLSLPYPTPLPKEDGYEEGLVLGTSFSLSYQQISSLAQARSSLFPFSTVKQLYVRESESQSIRWGSRIPHEEVQWLLSHFTAVETLYLSEYLARYVIPVLQKRGGERVTEMLPALDLQTIVYYWR